MFEQSIVATHPANKTWTLGVSIFAQVTLISAAILFPLVFTDNLPFLRNLVGVLVAPAPPPPAPPPAEPPRQAIQRTVSERPVFVAPSRTPTKVDMTPDEPRIEPYEFVVGSPGPVEATNPINRYLSQAPALPKADPPVRETTKSEPKPQAPIRVTSRMQEAKLLRRIIPIYPQLAIATRVQGTVHLVGVISKDGTIRDLQVLDGNPLLIRATLDAVRQWVYRPTILNNEPVEVIAPITVTFTLNR